MKVLRSFIIENFSKFGAIEFNCSRGYFQKVIVETFSKEEFEKKAVWKENHPEHKEFVKILKENVTDRLKDRVASNMVDLK